MLEGRTTLRELAEDPEFASTTPQGMHEFAETWQSMPPHERSDAVAMGERGVPGSTRNCADADQRT